MNKVEPMQGDREQRVRVNCMTKPNRSSIEISSKVSNASLKRSKTYDECGTENDSEAGPSSGWDGLEEEFGVLSMGVKRAKSSHRALLELEVESSAVHASHCSSSLYSA